MVAINITPEHFCYLKYYLIHRILFINVIDYYHFNFNQIQPTNVYCTLYSICRFQGEYRITHGQVLPYPCFVCTV